jgi:hypothetical protein
MAFPPGLQMSRDALSRQCLLQGFGHVPALECPGACGSGIAWQRWIPARWLEKSLQCGFADIQGIRSF